MVRNPKGMRDILPPETFKWRRLEILLSKAALLYGYGEIRTPILEFSELFRKGLGDESDVALKEMYEFEDKNGDVLSLRPEGTAPVARAVIQHHLYDTPVLRLFYTGPMFRRERPQAGRYRQFHQFGIEAFGVSEPYMDIEVLLIVKRIFSLLNLPLTIHINSLGCDECRPIYMEQLRNFVLSAIPEDEEIERFKKNPLKLFDSKRPEHAEIKAEAPKISECLCPACKDHYAHVIRAAKLFGVPIVEDPQLARGFDYYTRTVFEGYVGEFNLAVVGGGRYDHLVSFYGGPDVPGIGFAIGLERLITSLEEVPIIDPEPKKTYFLATTGEDMIEPAFQLAEKLRDHGIGIIMDLRQGKLQKQLKLANKVEVRYVLILGEEEQRNHVITLRDMVTGEQRIVAQEAVLDE
ncbi:histidine--tRNA ligase [Coprothermobacter proteolyticus]|uniref:histidine--tRNA ligase n=1 Tax=Coprothermobacter proteolyticus TaxID=35786 RepID=UPI000D2F9169|nr:histidine--tRNA ligase [Coprothermobacter proteolyticus]